MSETPQQAAERLTRQIGESVIIYAYSDAQGKLIFWNLRIATQNGKTFRMMSVNDKGDYQLMRPDELRPDAGWPLYGLRSLARGGPVFVVEGEKDCDTLHRLGLPAVTSGSTSTDGNANWSPLKGRVVVLWADNDKAGCKYMDRVAATLQSLCNDVQLIDLATLDLPIKGDVTDWLELHPGSTQEDVLALSRKAFSLQEPDQPRVILVRGDSIQPQPIKWVWEGWLAGGKLHLLAGQPGTGKTTIALALAAIITTGGSWPDGTRAQRGSVVVWSGEDDPEDTLAPRLRAAGADMTRVHFVTGMQIAREAYSFDPSRDMKSLEESLCGILDIRLIVIDPLVNAVTGDSHKNAEVRRGLQPLVELGQRSGCAVLGITHLSKGTSGREPIERVTGSLAFGALARVVLITAKRDDGEAGGHSRFITRAKSNIGPDGGGFNYGMVQKDVPGVPNMAASSVAWGSALDGSARDLLNDAEQQAHSDDAESFLRNLLGEKELTANEIFAEAAAAGYSKDSIKRAKVRAGVKTKKNGMHGSWMWSLATREGSEESTLSCSRSSLPSEDTAIGSGTFESLPLVEPHQEKVII